MARNEIVGMKELERSLKKLGKVPQASVTKAARAGARIAFNAAKRKAPKDTGELEQGIIMRLERKKKLGKAVFGVMMDPENPNFVKTTKDGKRYYYPAAQEFGFLTRDGGYVPGAHFMRDSINDNRREITQKTVDVLVKDIDKALKG